MEDLPTRMVRLDLRDIPQFALPAGYSVRLYRPGDADAWVWIHELADRPARRTHETFNEQFGHDLPAMEDRCFFLVSPDGRTIGTTTAWYEDDFFGRPFGRIHWVAIIPEFQGRGLAKPLMTLAMNRLAQSHDRCYLTTNTVRIPAVQLYLKFGFRPLVRGPEDESAWRQVRQVLRHPLLDGPPVRPEML